MCDEIETLWNPSTTPKRSLRRLLDQVITNAVVQVLNQEPHRLLATDFLASLFFPVAFTRIKAGKGFSINESLFRYSGRCVAQLV